MTQPAQPAGTPRQPAGTATPAGPTTPASAPGSALTDLVTESRVLVHQHADDWRQAITLAAEPLVADGSVTRAYVRSMIRSVETYGPYIVLTPHTALAHARPDGEVHRQAMSVLTLAEPVVFGHEDNDPVSIVFCLAAVDSGSHLEALQQFVSVARDAERLERLAQATSVAGLLQVLRQAPAPHQDLAPQGATSTDATSTDITSTDATSTHITTTSVTSTDGDADRASGTGTTGAHG